MTKAEFLKILNSNEVSEIRRVLESGHTPTSAEEINKLSERAIVANRIFQAQVLKMVMRISTKLAIPLLEELALKGIDGDIRQQALDRLLQCRRREVKRAILACTSDENLQIQLKALKSLKGWNDSDAIQLLIDRATQPESALLPEQAAEAEKVRELAIEALATKNATEPIQPLVKLMLREAQHRQVIIQTLTVIGGHKVIEALLEGTEGKLEDSPEPDEAFKLEAVGAIASIGLKRFARGQLERYRILLKDVYPAALKNTGKFAYVLEEAPRHLDDQVLEEVRKEFRNNLESAVAVQIINSMRFCNLKKAQPFWLDIFEHWRPTFQGEARTVFLELAKKYQGQVISFFQEALRIGGSRNKRDRLPDITKQLAPEMKIRIIQSLAPMLDEEQPRKLLQPYIESVWTGLPKEKHHEMVRALVRPSYKTEEALDEVAIFLAPRWREVVGNGEPQKLVVDILHEEWRKRPQKRRVESIINQMKQHIVDTRDWCGELARRAPQDLKGEEWTFFEVAFAGLPNPEQVQAIQETVNQQWHRMLVEYLYELDKEQTAIVFREHLQREGGARLTGDDRVWAISTLGDIGNTADFGLFGNEIEGKSEACAVASVKAIGAIDANAGQECLREALNSRKPAVVAATLKALEGISDLQPDTIQALRERAGSEERDEKIRDRAQAVIEVLRGRHLEVRPNPEETVENIREWLVKLEAFGPSETSGKILQDFLKDLGEREAPDIRKALAKSVSLCCLPETGLKIAESEARLERRQDVRVAWEDTIDEFRGFPDRGVFHLIERVCDDKLDHSELLGRWGLDEVFKNPKETLMGLTALLRRAERVKNDPDSVVERLDSTAELLIDEILWAGGEQPERFDKYANKIGKTKSICTKAARQAEILHLHRESAIGPHARDRAGVLREGVTPQEAEDSKKAFVGLFHEVVKFLRRKKEESV